MRIAIAIAAAAGLALAARADTPPAPTPTPSAAPATHKIARAGTVMGTNVQVTLWGDDDAAADAAFADVMTELRRLDGLMTTWTPDSEVSKINAAAGDGTAIAVSDETLTVIARALEISKKSKGLFDITVGAYQGLWKFDQDMDGTLPTADEVAARKKLVNWKDIVVDKKKKTVRLRRKGMAITLGGIAKGYAVDRACDVLRKEGFSSFIVQVGGDLYVAGAKGAKPWVVGIRDPRSKSRDDMFALAPIQDHSFSTSGDYERGFVKDGKRYHHILDPRTGYPAEKSRSVTVMAKDAFTADAWSKVLFIEGAERAMPEIVEKLPDFEAVFVDDQNQVHVSSGLDKVLVIQRQPTAGI